MIPMAADMPPTAVVRVLPAAASASAPPAAMMPSSLPASWRSAWTGYPHRVELLARCIAKHESWNAGLFKARNGRSTASGAFQILDGTWRGWLADMGLSGPPRAVQASPAFQARVAAWALSHGHVHAWNGTHCGYGT
jgi:hypothetical protein